MARSTHRQLAVVAVLAACSGTPALRIETPVARSSGALAGVCAVFLRIENPGDGDDALVEARAEVPGAVTQIHAVEHGRMAPRERIVVPARGAVVLAPGGLHIMVFHLPTGSSAVTEFTLRLRFERSGERRTNVRIVG